MNCFFSMKSGYPHAPAKKLSFLDLPRIYRFAINGCQVYLSRRKVKKKVLSAKEKRLPSQESSRKNQCAVLSAFSRLSAYKSSYSTMRLMVSVNSKYCSRLA